MSYENIKNYKLNENILANLLKISQKANYKKNIKILYCLN